MPASKLLQLVRENDLDSFETLCLEALEGGGLQLAELVPPFEELERHAQAARAATLGQMVLEHLDPQSDPGAALKIARIAVLGDPRNDELRERVVGLYRQVHGDKPGFDALLEMSGLTSGRPARNAIRLIDICLSLQPGDALISRTEEAVVEVLEVDIEHGLITLQHPRRPKTITPLELSREYERVAPDDFRVLRALKPDSLAELLQTDPVAVVIGLIHAHGEALSQDLLKSELVPKHLPAKDWSKWWNRARAKLRRCPHVIIEGRAPVRLRYTAEGWTLEDATWQTFESQGGPGEWLATLEGYLREKKKHKEEPGIGLLARCRAHLDQRQESIREPRPSEALACALVSERIDEIAAGLGEDPKELTRAILRDSTTLAKLIAGLEDDTLWNRALTALAAARPDDVALCTAKLVPVASAPLLDRLVTLACEGEAAELVQGHIDTALADPVDHPEIIYWLWKGPKAETALRLPPDDDLFALIVQTLSALGRTLNPDPLITKRFRGRVRTVLALRGYARAGACLQRVKPDRAITLRTQLERLEGLGNNARLKLLDLLRDVHPEIFVVHRRRHEPWEEPNVLWNTAAGIQKTTGRRDHLVNVTMRENAKRIGEAASHGDLSENSEYKFALEERDFLRARLAQMNRELSLASTLEEYQVPTDHVGVGSRVTLRDSSNNSAQVITFLGPFDADVEQGIYNYKAPVSQELMGLRVGDRKTLTMDDRECELEVVEIASGLTPETA